MLKMSLKTSIYRKLPAHMYLIKNYRKKNFIEIKIK